MNFLKKSIRISDALFLFGIMLAGSLAGNVLHEVIVNIDIHKESAEKVTTFPLGTLICIIVMMTVLLLTSFQVLSTKFDLSVGMGATRKEFFASEIINQLVRIGGAQVLLAICYAIEKLKLSSRYSMYECELDMTAFFDWKVQLPMFIALLGMTFFVSAVFLKFQKKAMLFFVIFYFVMMLFMTRATAVIKPFVTLLAETNIPFQIILPIAGLLIGGALMAGAWILIRKQAVTA